MAVLHKHTCPTSGIELDKGGEMMEGRRAAIAALLPQRAAEALERSGEVSEIRLRAGRPAAVTTPDGNLFLSARGEATPICDCPVVLSADELYELYIKLCRRSVYARAHELKEGYVTYEGCRVGIGGEVVNEGGQVAGFRRVTSVNIRIAREVKGAAEELVRHVLRGGGVAPTLVVAPPGGGKTTMLRDLARLLSLRRLRVAVIDERGELSGAGFDLGPMCETLVGLPKAKGMEMALRTLSPQVMIIDELGGVDEVRELLNAAGAGVPFVASCHASSVEELVRRPQFRLLYEAGVLEQTAILRDLKLQAVYDLRRGTGETDRRAADNPVGMWGGAL